ncbi:lipid storage droplets surface-binding protein 1 isoform X2 [Episyrphus balteatus]|uniref:lipid storage droplets surface-binding protein 1 isoform X2 n=1 Tax=Episyrphus balteatus TaxID=286459 RepID=UPI002485C157|nr:lipid storage droplets surface-binding protein 1 isoform X2 [Episyrphus balteatus]
MANNQLQNAMKLHLEAVDRIGSIPIIENSIKRAEHIYSRVKNTNRLFNWYFETAESTILAALESVRPAVKLFEVPLKRLDGMMCKSLDILEQRMPLVYLPPEMFILLTLKMYWNTREYMSDHLVRPVLKRADSVKQMGQAVLDNPLAEYAADRIDGAFTVADMYVDKYLTVDAEQDQVDGVIIILATNDENEAKKDSNEKITIKAIHHGQRFSRKLKRRLTQRTLLEARALKKQSKEAIHVALYAAELIATDPKMALQKARELWNYLSQDEPENQARPNTLEQLIVLLTRESARRLVHLINFTTGVAQTIPRSVVHSSAVLLHQIILLNERLIKITKLDKVKDLTKEEAESLINKSLTFYGNLSNLTSTYLERVAIFLSGRIEAEKISTTTTSAPRRRIQPRQNNAPTHNNINGIY